MTFIHVLTGIDFIMFTAILVEYYISSMQTKLSFMHRCSTVAQYSQGKWAYAAVGFQTKDIASTNKADEKGRAGLHAWGRGL